LRLQCYIIHVTEVFGATLLERQVEFEDQSASHVRRHDSRATMRRKAKVRAEKWVARVICDKFYQGNFDCAHISAHCMVSSSRASTLTFDYCMQVSNASAAHLHNIYFVADSSTSLYAANLQVTLPIFVRETQLASRST
jgi:hypothetical protein